MTKDNSVESSSDERKEFVQITVRRDSLEKYQKDGWELRGKLGPMVTIRKPLAICACHE